MPQFNISDLAGMDFYKKVLEDEKFAKMVEQLDDDQKAHVEQFVNEIKEVFMPSVTNFATALNEMTDEEREQFSESVKGMWKGA